MAVSKTFRLAMCAATILAAASSTALAFKVNVGPVHADTDHPLSPVKVDPVKVGPATVTPPTPGLVPTTPSITVKGNGAIAQAITKTDQLVHRPERAAQTTQKNIENTLAKAAHDAGDAIAKPFRDLGEWFKGLITDAEKRAKAAVDGVIKWVVIGLFAIAGVVTAETASLIARRRCPQTKLTAAE